MHSVEYYRNSKQTGICVLCLYVYGPYSCRIRPMEIQTAVLEMERHPGSKGL